MRVVVFGYHDVGCACLEALVAMRQEIPLVLTHEDDPDENIWFGSIRDAAAAHAIETIAPPDANAPAIVRLIEAAAPDAILSCYYRRILGPEILRIPPRGAYNMHGSLLPKYRGRAPVNWVLVNGESVTGVTLHHMTERPDRGDIVEQRAVPITDEDTALTLHRKVAAAAGALLREVWPLVEAGAAPRIPQDPAQASYFGRRTPEDGRIDWTRSVRECWNLVRALTHPYPGAFTFIQGRKLFLWKASILEPARQRAPEASPGSSAAGGGLDPGAMHGAERILPNDRNGVREPVPGTLGDRIPGLGVPVATGNGTLILDRVQIEGSEETSAERLCIDGSLQRGRRLG